MAMADVFKLQVQWDSYQYHDSLSRTEIPGHRYGVEGDTKTQGVYDDPVIVLLLFVVFIASVITYSRIKDFLVRQAKYLFTHFNEGTSDVSETTGEFRQQLLLILLTSMLLAIFGYVDIQERMTGALRLSSPYLLIGILMAIALAYFMVKVLLYLVVNQVFFNNKKNEHWMHAVLFTIIVEGAFLFLIDIMTIYLGISLQNAEKMILGMVVIVKMLLFSKSYHIFFRQNVVLLQIFLYFCALEIMPLLALVGVMEATINNIKIIF